MEQYGAPLEQPNPSNTASVSELPSALALFGYLCISTHNPSVHPCGRIHQSVGKANRSVTRVGGFFVEMLEGEWLKHIEDLAERLAWRRIVRVCRREIGRAHV